jgi:hypothetical protein
VTEGRSAAAIPDPAAWLREELDEALWAMGYVGLYEALWSINGSSLKLDPTQARALARSVVDELLADPATGLQLRLLTSPGAHIVSAPLSLSTLDDDASWDVGDRFVALIQPDLAEEQATVPAGDQVG